ncbi:ferrochelatase [Vibrio cidicii]|uniref:precorrin-2 dehydrogenase n=1 Tax=Vibrio cidicii TaxID=1763883 RepID=A0A151L1R4_9VIBR|nr:bifunctional precorrin-2 dehydrogenase/sirohydrochlorin ferrochelatase [Vibrio cidicii]KYN90040.1 ferrochelatase [Vibrio cidicii]
MRYFPLFMDLENKPVLVVGGGEVASRKIEALLKAGAKVTIVSPSLVEELLDVVKSGECHWLKSFYSSELINRHYVQVWATTDNPELNHQVYRDAKAHNVLVNVVDDKPYCDFITPSMINRGRIQIAISSGGSSPVLIRNIRESLEALLPQNLSLLADFAESKRNVIKSLLPSVEERRVFWEQFFARNDVQEATGNRQLEQVFSEASCAPLEQGSQCVWIRCSEDVELLPIKALRYMQRAEMVLYWSELDKGFLEMVRRDANRRSYSDSAQLAEMVNQSRGEYRNLCILFPKRSQAFNFMQGTDLVI